MLDAAYLEASFYRYVHTIEKSKTGQVSLCSCLIDYKLVGVVLITEGNYYTGASGCSRDQFLARIFYASSSSELLKKG